MKPARLGALLCLLCGLASGSVSAQAPEGAMQTGIAQPPEAEPGLADKRAGKQASDRALASSDPARARQLWTQALVAWQRARLQRPRDAELVNDMGFAQNKLKNFDAARQRYAEAMDLDPERWLACMNLVDMLLARGRPEDLGDADAVLVGASSTVRARTKILARRARVAEGRGRWDEARDLYLAYLQREDAVKRDRERFRLAELYRQRLALAEARVQYGAIGSGRYGARARDLQALVARVERLQAAREPLGQAGREISEGVSLLAASATEAGAPEVALQLLERWVAQVPDAAALHGERGRALLSLGRVESAELAQLRALALGGDAVVWASALARLYLAARPPRAREAIALLAGLGTASEAAPEVLLTRALALRAAADLWPAREALQAYEQRVPAAARSVEALALARALRGVSAPARSDGHPALRRAIRQLTGPAADLQGVFASLASVPGEARGPRYHYWYARAFASGDAPDRRFALEQVERGLELLEGRPQGPEVPGSAPDRRDALLLWRLRGDLLEAAAERRESYDRALALEPRDALARLRLLQLDADPVMAGPRSELGQVRLARIDPLLVRARALAGDSSVRDEVLVLRRSLEELQKQEATGALAGLEQGAEQLAGLGWWQLLVQEPVARVARLREELRRVDAVLGPVRHAGLTVNIARLQGRLEDLEADLGTRARAARQTLRGWAIAVGVALVLVWLSWLWWQRRHGLDLRTLLARHPERGPRVQPVLASIRHEVLKHNTMVLSGLGDLLERREPVQEQVAHALAALLGDGGQPGARGKLTRYLGELEQEARAVGEHLNVRYRDASLGALLRGFERLARLARRLRRADRASPAVREGLAGEVRAISAVLNEQGYDGICTLLAGMRSIEVSEASLRELFEQLCGEPQLAGCDARLVIVEGSDLPARVGVLQAHLEDILTNLLRNALQVSARGLEAEGPIEVGLEVRQELDPITGFECHRFAVCDRSEERLDPEAFGGRYIERGLGLVADLVARYEGAIELCERDDGWQKAVVVELPLAEEAST